MQTIQSVLEVTAQSYPDRTVLQLGDMPLTYRQLVNNIANIAHYLRSRGITSNDTVVLFFQNTPFCVLCFFALAWLNTSVIPLEPETSSSYTLDSVFCNTPFTVVMGDRPNIGRFVQSFTQENYSFIDIADLPLDPYALSDYTNHELVSSDRVFLYHYTSGSTGKPKATLHSQANLIKGGIIYKQTYQLRPEDSILIAVPLAHSFGMIGGLIGSLVSGSRLVLVERFVPRQVVETLAKEKITVLFAVPLIYDLLARCHLCEIPDLGALRICLSSGASLPSGIAKKFKARYHKPIYQVYGTTETGAITAQWPRNTDWPEGSVGCPLTDVFVRIVGEKGRDLPPNEPGVLLVKTSTIFTGYHKHSTAKTFQEGWYITGDIAWQDSAGHLYLSGRKETFINVGGKKVNPLEVEEVLLVHPMVKEAIVYGRDADSAGEQVQAAVVLRKEVSASELVQFCRERLALYKVPCHIEFVAVLPKTILGKTHRGMHSDFVDR